MASKQRDAIVNEIHEHLAAENAQDLDALLEGMTEDCYNYIVPDPSPLYKGPEEVAERYRSLWSALPDLAVEMRRIVAVDDDFAVSEHWLSGTHRGTLLGHPATGKSVKVPTCVVWELRGASIRGETVYFDASSMLKQIGLLDEAVS